MPDDDLHRLTGRLTRLLTTADSGRLVILMGAGMTVPEVHGVSRLTRRALDFSDQAGRARPRPELNEPVAVSPSEQRLRINRYIEAFQFIRDGSSSATGSAVSRRTTRSSATGCCGR